MKRGPHSSGPLAKPQFGTALVFEAGGRVCALPVEAVQEVAPMCQLFKPPGLSGLLEGFLNLRGAAVPVLRLDRLFNLHPVTPGLHTPLIVLKARRRPLALLVDQALDVTEAAEQDLVETPGDAVFQGCSPAMFRLADRTVHLLEPERLLLKQEQERISELQQQAQRRLDGRE